MAGKLKAEKEGVAHSKMAVAGGATSKREVVQITSYSRRLKENIKSILDNYGEILKAAKVCHMIIM